MKKSLLLILVALCISTAFAIWSDSSAENLKLTDSYNYEEVIPKIAYANNGNVWVTWFSNENGNYNVRAQMFSFDGEPAFSEMGMLISNNPQMSWLTDWDMKVDSQGNAVLAFLDERTGNLDIYAYKISPTGEMLWGETGIALCDDVAEDYTPTLGITDQDNVIVAWMTDDDTRMQKIMPDGTLAFDSPIVFHEEGFAITWAEILASENDSFFFRYAKDSGPFWAVTRHLLVQKYDTDLEPIWDEPTIITNQGGISSWTQNFPTASDGNGGFVICWYEDRDMDNMSNVYVQHVLADGTVGFAANGIQPTSNFSTQHFNPSITYDQDDNNIWLVWMETNSSQGSRGVRVQKIDSNGNRVFGLDGFAAVPISNDSVMPFSASFQNGEFVAAYTYDIDGNMFNCNIEAFKLDNNGDFVWEDSFTLVKSTASGASHMVSTSLQSNQLVFAWEDSRNSSTNIYLQNINFDGSLGVADPITGIEGFVTLNDERGNVAEVLIQIGEYQVYPNADGYYYLELEAGTYNISASLEDYQTTNIEEFEVIEGEIAQLDIVLEPIVSVSENVLIAITQLGNYPNPFNPNTVISFSIAEDGETNLSIYNSKGQFIRALKNEYLPKGSYQIDWNGLDNIGRQCSSGVYLIKLTNNNKALTHKMLMLK